MDNEHLIEVVARALSRAHLEKWDGLEDYEREAWFEKAEAAIAVIRPAVIEECAKVAQDFPAHLHGSLQSSDPALAAHQAAREIAAAIRALAQPQDGEG